MVRKQQESGVNPPRKADRDHHPNGWPKFILGMTTALGFIGICMGLFLVVSEKLDGPQGALVGAAASAMGSKFSMVLRHYFEFDKETKSKKGISANKNS